MVTPRVRLGELLVEARIITPTQLDQALAAQTSDGRRIGTLLIEAELVTETQVTQIVSQQLSVPWVSLYHIDFSRPLLNFVSQALAEKYCLVPIFVRRVRGLGDTLYLAMDDPSDEVAQREVSEFAKLPVRAMIAPPSDIRSAIRAYYAAGQDSSSLSEALAENDAPPPDLEPARFRAPAAPEAALADPPPNVELLSTSAVAASDPRSEPGAAPSRRISERPVPPPASRSTGAPHAVAEEQVTVEAEGDSPDSSPLIEVREIALPIPKRNRGGRMVSLTLLDGTQVNLPARGQGGTEKTLTEAPLRETPNDGGSAGGLTARDLVAALRAVSHGADAPEILGENVRWEALFAALLSLMLKKQLIADWEFVEEYKKV